MKRILLLLDGLHEPSRILTSILSIVKTDHSFVHIILLHRSYILANLSYPLTTDLPLVETQQEEDRQLLEDNLQLIQHTFSMSKVNYDVEQGDVPLEEILQNSAFADLILADARIMFSDLLYFPLRITFKDLLADAHCPVLLLREDISQVERIVLAYDGSDSSIYAMKHFSYLFPIWRSLPAYLVTIQASGDNELEHQQYIRSWLPRHFDHVEVEIMQGRASEELPGFINRYTDNMIVVMGSYGRTAVSRFFRQSLANAILEKTAASLFTTHE
ncbi:universal stress protein [Flavitalea sp. BT771]|uniref:universal stress protein n=1 Tax=Flavitalea sp. BT771 TaxID=3063329 RepID=UPI0026E4761E|nr:universal stress protein [Flavitalea sp. BT771]MDO6430564.1 universal stress protein [Flavitalea sp. BT771]MDV6219296.1 universal stress protein [Flavitalea sp. BT771]